MKTCCRCGQAKPLTEFYMIIDRSGYTEAGGWRKKMKPRPRCKACDCKANNTYRQKLKESHETTI